MTCANDSMKTDPFVVTKVLHHPHQILSWLGHRTFAPISLELDITLACDDRCTHCTYSFARSPRHLPLPYIEGILAEASLLGIRGLTLTGGGDPLAHPEVKRVVSAVREYRNRLAPGLYTNGSGIDSIVSAGELLDTFDWIRVSLGSMSESGFGSGGRGSRRCDRVRGIELLASRNHARDRHCRIGVGFLTSAANACGIVPATRLARELGVDFIQFKPMIGWDRKRAHHLSRIVDQTGVQAELARAAEYSAGGFSVLFSVDKYDDSAPENRYDYSAYHMAWFVVAVGPSPEGPMKPTLYLDCSSKYLAPWTIGPFEQLSSILDSPARARLIASTSSRVFCVPSDRHAVMNTRLEAIQRRHCVQPWSHQELAARFPGSPADPDNL